jgi:hypothetical protein
MTEASVERDRHFLKSWWEALLADQPPPSETHALWFGLFARTSGTTLYVQGYPYFDIDDETGEWATDEPSWTPEGRYVDLPSLQRSVSWQEALATALDLLRDLKS